MPSPQSMKNLLLTYLLSTTNTKMDQRQNIHTLKKRETVQETKSFATKPKDSRDPHNGTERSTPIKCPLTIVVWGVWVHKCTQCNKKIFFKKKEGCTLMTETVLR